MSFPGLYISIILIFILSPYLIAQNEFENNQESIEVPARFKNGYVNDFRLYIESIVEYPEIYSDEEIYRRIFIEFRIDTLGNLTDIKILRGLRKDFDDAVIKALIQSPKWIPATINNHPVSQRFAVPFYNRLRYEVPYKRF